PPGTILYRTWRDGARIVRAGDFDVVHVHSSTWSPMAGMTMWSAARAGIPVVATVHSLWDRYWPIFSAANWLFRWRRHPLVRRGGCPRAPVAVGKDLRAAGRGRRRHSAGVWPTAVSSAGWRTEPLPRNPRRVVGVSVMRLAPRKRPRHCVKMLRQGR